MLFDPTGKTQCGSPWRVKDLARLDRPVHPVRLLPRSLSNLQLTGSELESPRGRIYLARSVAEEGSIQLGLVRDQAAL